MCNDNAVVFVILSVDGHSHVHDWAGSDCRGSERRRPNTTLHWVSVTTSLGGQSKPIRNRIREMAGKCSYHCHQ